MLFESLREFLGLSQAKINKDKIKTELQLAKEAKRKELIVDQIRLYSQSLHNSVDITTNNAFLIFFNHIQDNVNDWYNRYNDEGHLEHSPNNTISKIALSLPEGKLSGLINALKSTIAAYQVYSKSENVVNKGLTIGIAATSTALSAATSPILGSAVYSAGTAVKSEVSNFLRYTVSLISLNIMQAIQGSNQLVYDRITIEEFWLGLSVDQKNLIEILAEEHFKYLLALDNHSLDEKTRDNYQKLLIQTTVILSNSIANDIEESLNHQTTKNTLNKFTDMLKRVFNQHSLVSSFNLQARIFSTFSKNCEVVISQETLFNKPMTERIKNDKEIWKQLKTLASNQSSKLADIEQYNISLLQFNQSTSGKNIFLGSDYCYFVENKIYVSICSGEENESLNSELENNVTQVIIASKNQLKHLIENPQDIDTLIYQTKIFLGDEEHDSSQLDAIHESISSIKNQSHLEFLEYKRKVRVQVLELTHLLACKENFLANLEIIHNLKNFYTQTLHGNTIDFEHAKEKPNDLLLEKKKLAELIHRQINPDAGSIGLPIFIGTNEYWCFVSNSDSTINKLIQLSIHENNNRKLQISEKNKNNDDNLSTVIKNTKIFLDKLKQENLDLFNLYRAIVSQEIAARYYDPLYSTQLTALNQFRRELDIPLPYLDDLRYSTTTSVQENNIAFSDQLDFYFRASVNQSTDDIYRLKLIPISLNEKSVAERFVQLDKEAAYNRSEKAFIALKGWLPKDISHNRLDQAFSIVKDKLQANENKPRLNTVDFTNEKGIVRSMFATVKNTVTSYGSMRVTQYGAEQALLKVAEKAGGIAPIAGQELGGIAKSAAGVIAKPLAKVTGFMAGIISFKILQKLSNRKDEIVYKNDSIDTNWQLLPNKIQNQISNIVDIYCYYLALLDKKSLVSDDEIKTIRLQLGNAIIVLSTMKIEEREQQANALADKRSIGTRVKSTLKSWLGLIQNESEISPEDLQSSLYTILGNLSGDAASLIKNNPWAKFWHAAGERLRKSGAGKLVDAIGKIYENSFIVNSFSILQIEQMSPDKRAILTQEKTSWDDSASDARNYQLLQAKPETYLATLKQFSESLKIEPIRNKNKSGNKISDYSNSIFKKIAKAQNAIQNSHFTTNHKNSPEIFNNHFIKINKKLSKTTDNSKKILEVIHKEADLIQRRLVNLKLQGAEKTNTDSNTAFRNVKSSVNAVIKAINNQSNLPKNERKILIGAESSYYIAYMEHVVPNNKNIRKLRKYSIALAEQARAQFNDLIKPESIKKLKKYLQDTRAYLDSFKESSNDMLDYFEYINRVRVQILQIIYEISKNKFQKSDEILNDLEIFYIEILTGDQKDIDFSKLPDQVTQENQFDLAQILTGFSTTSCLLGSSQLWNSLSMSDLEADREKRDAFDKFKNITGKPISSDIDTILTKTQEIFKLLMNLPNQELYRIYRDVVAKQIAELSRSRSLNTIDNMKLNKFWQDVLCLPLNYKDDLDLLFYISNQNLKYVSLYLRAVTIEQPIISTQQLPNFFKPKISPPTELLDIKHTPIKTKLA